MIAMIETEAAPMTVEEAVSEVRRCTQVLIDANLATDSAKQALDAAIHEGQKAKQNLERVKNHLIRAATGEAKFAELGSQWQLLYF